jgi:hypothetical protein
MRLRARCHGGTESRRKAKSVGTTDKHGLGKSDGQAPHGRLIFVDGLALVERLGSNTGNRSFSIAVCRGRNAILDCTWANPGQQTSGEPGKTVNFSASIRMKLGAA